MTHRKAAAAVPELLGIVPCIQFNDRFFLVIHHYLSPSGGYDFGGTNKRGGYSVDAWTELAYGPVTATQVSVDIGGIFDGVK